TSETNAATSQADSLTEANRAKVEADRAKAEADRAATGNAIVGALNSIDATTHVVDFKAMPKVNGVDVTAALTSGGFQVNSNVVCGDGETNNTDKLQDNKYSGKSFMVAKPKTVNSTTGVTSNGAPAAMEYDWAVCNDFYGTWTPTGGIEGKTRVQTIYDKNAIWVRGYHHQDATWTPWKRVNSQFYNNVSGIDANTITTDGSYFYFKDTAQVTTPNTPHIDSPEDSDVYFLTVNADDSGKEIVQTVLSPKTNSRFDRYCVNGSWSRWWNSTATIDFDTAPAGFNLDNETNPGFWNCELS
ncbi:pyocin knob domain-containing protein, partial [Herbiconiux daphne]